MGWWSLSGPNDEVLGDEAADAAVAMLAPLKTREPRPTANELCDALEAVLLAAGPDVVAGELGDQHVTSADIERVRGTALPALVTCLTPGVRAIAEVYRENFKRPPSLREVLAAISFELRPRPGDYVRDFPGETMSKLRLR